MSEPSSRTSTPRSFTNQSATAEDLLKNQTVGLVNLSEFRKRRADALEQKEKDAQDKAYGRFRPSASGTATPDAAESDSALTPVNGSEGPPLKKKKKKPAKGLLSFQDDEGEADTYGTNPEKVAVAKVTARDPHSDVVVDARVRKLTPNPRTSLPAPKVLTKASLQAEAITREKLRQEFLVMQEAVRSTEVLMPFVFYDGTNIPGGAVRMKKGDHIWLFLDRCRKVGAELGVSGGDLAGGGVSKSKNDTRREWARVGVDDLMCVRGEVIVPHHYELYYFIANRITNPSMPGSLLFDYTNTADTSGKAEDGLLLQRPTNAELEGHNHDPALTKVVDRRWYEKNKHIYPATLWKEYESGNDFEHKILNRRDVEGNAFFFG